MVAGSYSASLVSRFAVPEKQHIPQGYYRSKLFIVSSATNPLIAAAGPLFSLLERLCISPSLPAIDEMRSKIEHEVYAFHSRLLGQGYTEEFIVIAKYLLCATIDELLGKNYLRLYQEPLEFKSFISSSNDEVGPEKRFFDIIIYVKDHANQYLDLLELAYYCLIVGFEGEEHLKPDGKQTLDNLIDELYQLIQAHRVHKPLRLFNEKSAPLTKSNKRKSFILTGLMAIGALGIIYCLSHMLLENKAKHVLHNHVILATLDN